MPESIRRNGWPAVLTAVLGLLVYVVVLSSQAGALAQRVLVLEKQQAESSEKIDRLLMLVQDTRSAVARVEGRLEARK